MQKPNVKKSIYSSELIVSSIKDIKIYGKYGGHLFPREIDLYLRCMGFEYSI